MGTNVKTVVHSGKFVPDTLASILLCFLNATTRCFQIPIAPDVAHTLPAILVVTLHFVGKTAALARYALAMVKNV